MAGTALVVAAFGVLIIGQAISALALAATLPVWAQYALLIPLGLCCLVLIGVCVALVRSWLRLRAIHQVDMNALEALRVRARTRQDGLEHFQAARAGLEKYLLHYPLNAKGRKRLHTAGIQPEEIESLARSRDRLAGFSTDSRSWLTAFREEFQNTLDAAARKRVDIWSLKAAGCVIASPLPLLDAVLVLSISLKMIKDLCFIYNVRATRSGTFILMNRAVAAAFIAGVAEGAAEVAGGMAAEELSGAIGESALNSFGAKAAGVIAPKLGEGAINAFFVRRLGKAAIRLLQPLRPQK
ncbi:MAG: YcjF family protein [Planctomycetota bacterium]|nr:YcjF family protein [Planctomycetota bacterium]